jgi:hypothetical protein
MNEQATQWTIKELKAGAAAATLLAILLAFGGITTIGASIAAAIAAILAGYAAWMSLEDNGSGVCIYAPIYLDPLVVSNPCPPGY